MNDAGWQVNNPAPIEASTTVGATPGGLNLVASKSQYLDMPDVPLSGDITLQAWVNLKGNSPGTWARIFDIGQGGADDNIYLAFYGGSVYLGSYVGASESKIGTDIVADVNGWHQYTATISSTGLGRIYIDGKLLKEGVVNIPDNVLRGNGWIGRSNWTWTSDAYLDAQIAEVRVWDRELSASEVASTLSTPLSGDESGLAFYAPLTNGSLQNHVAGSSGVTTTFNQPQFAVTNPVTLSESWVVNPIVLSQSPGGADTSPEVQPLVALAHIKGWADRSWALAPTLKDYADLGVAGVTAANLGRVNSRIEMLSASDVDTAAKIQAAVTAHLSAIAVIEAWNNGNGIVPAAPTVNDYAAAGVKVVTAANLDAVNATLLARAAGETDSAREIQAQLEAARIKAVQKIEAYNNGTGTTLLADGTTAPTVYDYALAGVSGVTSTNLKAVNAQILASARGGADWVGEISAMVVAADVAVAQIESYNNSSGLIALTAANYTAAGVFGAQTTASGAHAGGVTIAKASSQYVTLPTMTMGGDVTLQIWANLKGIAPSQYSRLFDIGQGQNDDNIIVYFNSNRGLGVSLRDGAPEIQVNSTSDIVPIDGWHQYSITVSTGGYVRVFIDGTQVLEGQSKVLPNLARNMAYIGKSNWGADPYLDAQFADVRIWDRELSASEVRSSVVSSRLIGSESGLMFYAPLTDGVMANARQGATDVLGFVNGASFTGTNPLTIDLSSAINPDVLGLSIGQADTTAEIQARVSLTRIYRWAASAGNQAPTLDDYLAVGISGVDAGSLAIMNSRIEAANAGDADTVAKVQAFANGLASDVAVIENWNNGNGVSPAAPQLVDYTKIGIAGVTQANLSAINDRILASLPGEAGNVDKIQAIVSKYLSAKQFIDAFANDERFEVAATGTSANYFPALSASDTGIVSLNDSSAFYGSSFPLSGFSDNTTGNNGSHSNGQFPYIIGWRGDMSLTNSNVVLQVPDRLILTPRSGQTGRMPNDFDLQGYDPVTAQWVTIETFNYTLNTSDTATFNVTKRQNQGFTGFRLNIRSTVTSDTFVNFSEFDMMSRPVTKFRTPSLSEYQAMGFPGVTAEKVGVLNEWLMRNAVASDIDTLAKRAVIVSRAVIEGWNNDSTVAPTQEDYSAIGVTGVTLENLFAVNVAVRAAENRGGADTTSEVQALVSLVAPTTAKIESYNNSNGSSAPVPTVSDYTVMGVTTVGENNLSRLNAVVLAADPGAATSAAKIQILASKWLVEGYADAGNTAKAVAAAANYFPILTGNNDTGVVTQNDVGSLYGGHDTYLFSDNNSGSAGSHSNSKFPYIIGWRGDISLTNTNATPQVASSFTLAPRTNFPGRMPQDFDLEGYDPVSGSWVKIQTFNYTLNTTDAATFRVTEKQDLGFTGFRINVRSTVSGAADTFVNIAEFDMIAQPAVLIAPTLTDYQNLGITGITSQTLPILNAWLRDKVVATDVNTTIKLQAALSKAIIEDWNNDGVIAPTLSDYALAGVTGVTLDNLPAVNVQVRAAANNGGADTTAKVQALVTLANETIARIESYNNGNGINPTALTAADYAAAGITGVTTDNLAAMNATVLARSVGGADTCPEIQALVATANAAIARIEAWNNGNGAVPTAPTVADYAAAGITGVSIDNLALVNSRILALGTGGADTCSEIQTVVAGVAAAVAKIDAYHKGDGTSPVALTVADYTALGVAGVTTETLAAVNARVLGQMQAEILVNSASTRNETRPQSVMLADGGWVQFFDIDGGADGSGTGVYMQRFAADGQPVGAQTRINSTTNADQSRNGAVALPDGGWVVTWASAGQDGSGTGVYMQRFNADGTAQGSETRVNTTTANDQGASNVALLAGGGWVVTWHSYGQDGRTNFDIYQQRFTAEGYSAGAEALVNTTTGGDQKDPRILPLGDGGWVVAWASPDASGTGLFFQRYAADGSRIGGETSVNTTVANDQNQISLTALVDGSWVAVWTSNLQDGSNTGVYLQRFDVNGSKVGGESLVNTTTTNQQSAPAVVALANGGWIVTWQSYAQDVPAANAWGVYQQLYDASGSKSGGERLVNATVAGDQQLPGVTALGDGGWIVSWQAYGQDSASSNAVYQQRFAANGSSVRVDLTTIAQIQILANEVTGAMARIVAWSASDGTGAAPSVDDYRFVGITGVTARHLAAVNWHVLNAGIDAADTVAEIQGLVTQAAAAVNRIETYNNGDGTTPASLTLADYAQAGIVGVTTANLAIINSRVLAQNPFGADSIPEIQGIVSTLNSAVARIEAFNNGNGITPAAPSIADYAAAGVIGVKPDNLGLVNASVLALAPGAAASTEQIQSIANGAIAALAKIENYNNSNGIVPAAPVEADYVAAGVTGVTSANLAAVNAQVLAAPTGGADTSARIQALVVQANAALNRIEAYNNGDGTVPAALILNDYAAAGISGVTVANLAAVNAQVLLASAGGANTVARIQALVSAGDAALTRIEAYNNGSGTVPAALSVEDYRAAGVASVNMGNLAAVNAQVFAAKPGAALTVPAIEALVAAGNAALARIEAFNNGDGMSPEPLSIADYASAGVTGVGAANLAAVNAQVLRAATGGADTVGEVQALVTAANQAIAAIEAYNNGNGTAALGVADYTAAGVSGVSAGNVAAVNAQVLAAAPGGADTPAKVQSLVARAGEALARIEAWNSVAGAAPLTLIDYQTAGVTGVNAGNLGAVNAQIRAASAGGADTNTKIQALVGAADAALARIEQFNNGDGTQPAALTLGDYDRAGILGVDALNLGLVNAKVLQADIGGADTHPEIQALVSQQHIQAFADDELTALAGSLGLRFLPNVHDYQDAHVTGVTSDNLDEVNAVIAQSDGAATQTLGEIQYLLDRAVNLVPAGAQLVAIQPAGGGAEVQLHIGGALQGEKIEIWADNHKLYDFSVHESDISSGIKLIEIPNISAIDTNELNRIGEVIFEVRTIRSEEIVSNDTWMYHY